MKKFLKEQKSKNEFGIDKIPPTVISNMETMISFMSVDSKCRNHIHDDTADLNTFETPVVVDDVTTIDDNDKKSSSKKRKKEKKNSSTDSQDVNDELLIESALISITNGNSIKPVKKKIKERE